MEKGRKEKRKEKVNSTKCTKRKGEGNTRKEANIRERKKVSSSSSSSRNRHRTVHCSDEKEVARWVEVNDRIAHSSYIHDRWQRPESATKQRQTQITKHSRTTQKIEHGGKGQDEWKRIDRIACIRDRWQAQASQQDETLAITQHNSTTQKEGARSKGTRWWCWQHNKQAIDALVDLKLLPIFQQYYHALSQVRVFKSSPSVMDPLLPEFRRGKTGRERKRNMHEREWQTSRKRSVREPEAKTSRRKWQEEEAEQMSGSAAKKERQ